MIEAVIGNKGRGLTVAAVRGFGQQFGERAARVINADMAIDDRSLYRRAVLLTKVRLGILVLDEDVQAMVDAIAKHAHTAIIGDGRARPFVPADSLTAGRFWLCWNWKGCGFP